MNSTLITLIIMLLITAIVAGIILTQRHLKAKQHRLLTNSSDIENWITSAGGTPTDFHFYQGTAVGICLQSQQLFTASPTLRRAFLIKELVSVRAHESVTQGRLMSAAPGVVEKHDVKNFNIDMSTQPDQATPTLLFPDYATMQAWKQRLDALIIKQGALF